VESPFENADTLVSDRFILLGALRGVWQDLPPNVFLWGFGMFDHVIHSGFFQDCRNAGPPLHNPGT
jgi:hypothetical protein